MPGSVSKWVLQHSPVPVIVVRPNSKRAKNKRKRLQDPTRTGYRDLLDKSNPQGGGHLLDSSNKSILPSTQNATEEEAAAVAAAIGVNDETPSPGPKENPLTKVESARTDTSTMSAETGYSERDTSPEATRSPIRVMKSPDEGRLETPDLSEEDEDAGEEAIEEDDVDDAADRVADLAVEANAGA